MGQKANGEIGFYASFKAEENWTTESGLDFQIKHKYLNGLKRHIQNGVMFGKSCLKMQRRPLFHDQSIACH